MSLADTISTASAFAARTGAGGRRQPEMIGIGAANLAAGLFQGFPVSTSGSRTAVAEQAGAKTQVTGLVGAGAIIADDRVRARAVPEPAPARARRGRDRRRRSPWPTSRARCGSTASAGSSSCCRWPRSSAWPCSASCPASPSRSRSRSRNVFRRAWWPYQAVLGRVDGPPGLPRPPAATRLQSSCPGCVIFRFDAPLFFANARTFRDGDPEPRRRQIRRRAGSSSRPSPSPTSTPPQRTCSRTSTRP